MAFDFPASPTVGQQFTPAGGPVYIWNGYAWAVQSVAISAGGPPQGRLTLQSNTPVMTTTQAAKTAIFYTPYVGNQIPLYNGTSMVMTTFAELTVATTDTTKNPAAIGASKVNDWFIWNDSGTIRLGHGVDWASDTTRGAPAALTMINGILLNGFTITNGPAAQRGTYVGTTRSNASSQLDWIIGGTGAGGVAAFFGVWNCYNRVDVSAQIIDNTASWSYTSLTFRQKNASPGNQVSFVAGLNEDAVQVIASQCVQADGTGVTGIIGISIDSTTTTYGSAQEGTAFTNGISGVVCVFSGTLFGFHFFAPIERITGAGTATFYGSGRFSLNQNSFAFQLRM